MRDHVFRALIVLSAFGTGSAVFLHAQTIPNVYSCQVGTCPNHSTCTGDLWEQSGTCSIQCLSYGPGEGQVHGSGTAGCGEDNPDPPLEQ